MVAKVPVRVLARASARAIAVDDARLYYGDSEEDGVFAVPKVGGDPVRIARHAPVSGALALEGGFITWIASPGDAVLRAPVTGGAQPTTLRDHGIFADVAGAGDELFVAEALGAGGALLRVGGRETTKLASFEGAPRAVMADAAYAYVVTPSRIVRVAHARGELETVATGARFTHAELDDAYVYVIADAEHSRAVLRFPKQGGDAEVLARDVRDAPIRVHSNELLYFDGSREALMALPLGPGTRAARVVLEDETLAVVSALEADASSVYLALGARESAVIVAAARTAR
ncbi:MAG: hypothetical protein JWP97_5151 [Labilithrix sp.]|nr:hypothetical protein [Labilithrix sp.]